MPLDTELHKAAHKGEGVPSRLFRSSTIERMNEVVTYRVVSNEFKFLALVG